MRRDNRPGTLLPSQVQPLGAQERRAMRNRSAPLLLAAGEFRNHVSTPLGPAPLPHATPSSGRRCRRLR
eukprot:9850155-Heterocapsa_arctica.AAC.1